MQIYKELVCFRHGLIKSFLWSESTDTPSEAPFNTPSDAPSYTPSNTPTNTPSDLPSSDEVRRKSL